MKLYSIAPSDDCFNDMKAAAMVVWNKYREPYRSQKLERVKDIKNVADNFIYIFAMFDTENQIKVVAQLKEETKEALRERLVSGGNSERYLNLIGL